MASLQSLKDELVNDPLARGYAGMTDAAIRCRVRNLQGMW